MLIETEAKLKQYEQDLAELKSKYAEVKEKLTATEQKLLTANQQIKGLVAMQVKMSMRRSEAVESDPQSQASKP